MDEIVKDFLIESNENLDRLDQELVRLESEPSSKELLASIFRTIHTIKGSCGFLGFSKLEKVAHAGENLLSNLRDGELLLDAEMTSGLLAMVDAVRQMLGEIQATQRDGDDEYGALIEKIKGLQVGHTGVASVVVTAAPQPAAKVEVTAPPEPVAPAAPVQRVTSSLPAGGFMHRPAEDKFGGLLVERGIITAEQLALGLRAQDKGDVRKIGDIVSGMGFCKIEDVNAAHQILEARQREAAGETIRVGVSLIDKLMNLVGELVLARNQLLQFSNTTQDAAFHAVSQRMDLIASELQEEVMKTRMQPIGIVWNKFPRTVRDLAHNCGKEVRLEMEGQDTELDRTIIEGIKDPLTHLVRNAVDHGIETPEARREKGKDTCGCVTLRAFHEGGQVNIEISDDGGGLSVDRIRKKALERGLITTEQSSRMPERDIFNLIFLPGFSTAEKVTNVSGRGVGMDVVKTNVEKIGGSVDVQSTLGQGTTVRVKIPLTLAIIPALLVTCRGERFAIPQVSLTELVRLAAEDTGKGIETVHGAPVYRLRGQLLPLVYLHRELRLAPHPGDASGPGATNIVVLQAEDRQFGLVVDEITDTEEIVVKPLGKQLKGIPAFSGATIMGDGRVALILDILGLAQRAQVINESRESALAEKEKPERKEQTVSDRQTLLLVQIGTDGRMAIPLSLVARLEEFPLTAIEHAGSHEVMQYRGQIMPLLRLAEVVPGAGVSMVTEDISDSGRMQVVVYSSDGRSIGLVVDRIVDIVEEIFVVQRPAERRGVLGSTVIQQRVTDLLDVPGIVRDTVPSFAELLVKVSA